MAITQVADIFEPQEASQYLLERHTERNAFIQSGILGSDPEIEAAALQAGNLVDMPFWNDLDHDTGAVDRSKVATDDTTEITPDKAGTSSDAAMKMFRTQAWETAAQVRFRAGEDPLGLFLDRYVAWWAREYQRILFKILDGVFADATMQSDHESDVSTEDGNNASAANLISNNNIETARFLLGDAYDMLTGMCVHSTVLKKMRELDLITFRPESDQQQVGKDRPFYGDIRVHVDDKMAATAGGVSGFKYTTYLFGAGAIAFQPIPVNLFNQGAVETEAELHREPLEGTGAGTITLATRQYFIMHPRGVKLTVSPSAAGGPSDSDLSTDNWTRVYQKKNIRIVKLVTNG